MTAPLLYLKQVINLREVLCILIVESKHGIVNSFQKTQGSLTSFFFVIEGVPVQCTQWISEQCIAAVSGSFRNRAATTVYTRLIT